MTARVLIVGAGPTGLTLATLVRQMGVSVHLIDKREGMSPDSKALAINQLNQFCWEAHAGYVPFGQHALQLEGVNICHQGQRISGVDFRRLPLKHRFALCQPQWTTESELRKNAQKLGVEVRSSTQFNALVGTEDGVRVTLSSGGRSWQADYSYVVGCDGGHSSVRKAVGIQFTRKQYPQYLVLADYNITAAFSRQRASYLAIDGALFVLVPLPDGQFRVVGMFPGTLPAVEQANRELHDRLLDHFGADFLSGSPSWTSAVQLSVAIASRLREGRVFIAGDAAHLYSPLGGTGMNTGMQDAMNLAWKLAWSCRAGKPLEELLESYQQERHAIHQLNGQETDTLMSLAVFRDAKAVEAILPKFSNRQLFKSVLPRLRAGMTQRYLSVYPRVGAGDGPSKLDSPELGCVFPQLLDLRAHLRNVEPEFNLSNPVLLMGDRSGGAEAVQGDHAFSLARLVSSESIRKTSDGTEHSLPASIARVLNELGENALFVRPDGVVGARLPASELPSLRHVFQLYTAHSSKPSLAQLKDSIHEKIDASI